MANIRADINTAAVQVQQQSLASFFESLVSTTHAFVPLYYR